MAVMRPRPRFAPRPSAGNPRLRLRLREGISEVFKVCLSKSAKIPKVNNGLR
jgi:hypothetical protein